MIRVLIAILNVPLVVIWWILKTMFCHEVPNPAYYSAISSRRRRVHREKSRVIRRRTSIRSPVKGHRRRPAAQPQVMDTSLLSGCRALVLGAGAVGGHVAYLLSTVIDIELVDFDSVESKNIQGGRTIYESNQVGMRKVDAAKAKIERDYPYSKVNAYPYNIMDLKDEDLLLPARNSTVVINAVDDAKAMLRVNTLFYPVTEVLYVAMHSGAASGHIIITFPFVSACLSCSLRINSSEGIQTLHGEPGLGLDIRHVANQCATIALEIMYAKVTGQPIERWDINKNIFYFANKREPLSPDGPGVILQKARKLPGCPICSISPTNYSV
jgi:molybdopterin/thiamine biosynthesis adenylyltransferase